MIAAFDSNGNIKPLRFKHRGVPVNVDKLLSAMPERRYGSDMMAYKCETNGEHGTRQYVLYYEIKTFMWWIKV